LEQYGKFHASSAAMREQQPDTFKQIVEGIQDIWGKVTEKTEGYLQKKLMQKSFFGIH
jgi:predicted sugar kinase